MAGERVKIGIVAPASRVEPVMAEKLQALVAARYPDRPPELIFSPQCFLSAGHFAGDDESRARAFIDMANDPSVDALWFGRGGYGSCRLVEKLPGKLQPAARRKIYLGYSDVGTLLAALHRDGFPFLAHGPMPSDLRRPGGETAVARALDFLVAGAVSGLEPSLAAGTPAVAFNLTILCHLLGTPIEPRLDGQVLMIEDVDEPMYRIDRCLFQLTANPAIRKVAGIRLGRCAPIPPNVPEFGASEEEITRRWCESSGIPYLGRADIGHDIDNKIVPFSGWVTTAVR